VSRLALPYQAYGATGDYVGARRNRRSFQLAVVMAIGLTAAFWFSETYLRYDLHETQYRQSLSLHDESARPLMRNVVRRDLEQSEAPTARYIEALAEIEEPGFELQRYEQAYQLDPTNSILVLKYGCQLFKNRQYREARERFREAAVQPPKNALPRYLEAAALAAATGPEETLAEAIALLARTNNTHDPVIYPKPLWHASLPTDGALYAEKMRDQVDRSLAPLYQFSELLARRARRALEEGTVQEWDPWLEKFQEMGERIVGTPESADEEIGVSQSLAGIHFQLLALEIRNEISRKVHGVELPGAMEAILRLNTARETLAGAEDRRIAMVKTAEDAFAYPLELVVRTLLVLFVMLVFLMVVCRMCGSERALWTIPQPRSAYLAAGLGMVVLLFVLLIFSFFTPEPGSGAFRVAAYGWWGIVAALAVIALLYPAVILEAREHVEGDSEALSGDTLPPEGKFVPALALSRRYVGVLLGMFLMTVCVWVILFRLTNQVYPTELELLAPGFRNLETEAVRQVQTMLWNANQGL